MEPSSTQKFAKNKQAGSEAYIPTLLVSSDQWFTQRLCWRDDPYQVREEGGDVCRDIVA